MRLLKREYLTMRPDLGEHLYRNKKFLDLLAGKTFHFNCPMQVCKAAEGVEVTFIAPIVFIDSNKMFCITLRFPHSDFERVTESAKKLYLPVKFGELCKKYKNEYECYRPINAILSN